MNANRRHRYWPLFVLTLACVNDRVGLAQGTKDKGEPLHAKIDRLIEGASYGPPAAVVGDGEFLRRVSLDLAGMPPSLDDLNRFLADTSPDKRAKAIDRLLASPHYPRHLATTLDVMLMERRANTNITADEWQAYLLQSVRDGKPLDQLSREILAADGADPKLRPAARFYLDRGGEPNLLTRDVGRIFLGRDMQCAQCHNHPLIEDYQQSDYHGLLAFLTPGYVLTRKEGDKEKSYYAEKVGGDLAFDSVFVKNDKHLTGPRILGGIELAETALPPGEEYSVKPADGVLPVPKASRRAKLASLVTNGSNPSFNQNLANRLWATMMGRGLVHPLDLHHPANPPTNPALLALLGEELARMKFDMKGFLRELALTRTYQRAIEPPIDPATLSDKAGALLATLESESQTLKGQAEAAQKAYSEAINAWHAAETKLVPVIAERDGVQAKYAGVATKGGAADKAVADAKAAVAARVEVAKRIDEVASKAQEAAKTLPQEKDLAAAAQKFVDRSASLKVEIAALQKASDEKVVAAKKVADELAVAAKTVEAARAKVAPIRDEVRGKESVVLAARRKMAESRTASEVHQKRLASVEAYVHLKTIQKDAAVAEGTLTASREALAQAQKRKDEFAPTIEARQKELASAEGVRLQAEAAAKAAQLALDARQKVVASVADALKACEAAQIQLPGDPALVEVVGKLKAKSDGLALSVSEPKAKLAAATSELTKAVDLVATAEKARAAALAEKARRDGEHAAARVALDGAETSLKGLKAEIASESEAVTAAWSEEFSLAGLKPLTPEQMCWSILKVTGVYDRYRQVETAELDKTKPLTAAMKADPAQLRAREAEVESRTFDKLKATVPAFISVYAAAAGQPQNDFFATADQALFVANGGSVNSWVAPAGDNVSARMVAEKDPKKAAEDLYLTIFARKPTSDESADVARILTEQAKEKPAAVQELVWALLMSVEFRFNH